MKMFSFSEELNAISTIWTEYTNPSISETESY